MTWAYLGPFFDGEGSVGIYIYKEPTSFSVNPRLTIGNTFYAVIDSIVHLVEQYGMKSSTKTYHAVKYFYLDRFGDIKTFIENILPFSFVKRAQLEVMYRGLCLFSDARKGAVYLKNDHPRLKEIASISLELAGMKSSKRGGTIYKEIARGILES
jgi:hypothetical protein